MRNKAVLFFVKVSLVLMFSAIQVVLFPPISFGDDLKGLEKRVENLEKKEERTKPSTSLSRVRLGGYAEFEYEDTQGKKSTFDQHRLVLNIAARITDFISFNSEIEYEHGTNEIELEQAYIDFTLHELVTVRAGAILVPLGRLNLYHDAPLLETTSRPMVDRFIIPTTWTEAGVGLLGEKNFGGVYHTGYQVYLVNGLSDDISVAKGLRDARGDLEQDNNSGKSIVGRAFFRYRSLLEVGISGFSGKIDEGNSASISLYAVDGLLKYSIFEIAGEYAAADISDASLSIPSDMDGFYVEGRVHLLPPSLNVPSWAKNFTVLYRYGEIDTDKDVPDLGDRMRHTLGMNYRPIPTVSVKGEYQFNDESGLKVDNDTLLFSVAFYF